MRVNNNFKMNITSIISLLILGIFICTLDMYIFLKFLYYHIQSFLGKKLLS